MVSLVTSLSSSLYSAGNTVRTTTTAANNTVASVATVTNTTVTAIVAPILFALGFGQTSPATSSPSPAPTPTSPATAAPAPATTSAPAATPVLPAPGAQPTPATDPAPTAQAGTLAREIGGATSILLSALSARADLRAAARTSSKIEETEEDFDRFRRMAEAVRQGFVFESMVNDIAETAQIASLNDEASTSGDEDRARKSDMADTSWMLRAGATNFAAQMQAYMNNA